MMQCVCGQEMTELGQCQLPMTEGTPLAARVWQCSACGRLALAGAEALYTVADYEARLQDKTAEELTLLAFTAETAREREAAENVLWNKYHEMASY